jgi:putative ABC transport system permease protein
MKFSELIETLRIAWNALIANKLRSFLSSLGVMVGIFIVIMMGWLLDGLDGAVSKTFEILGEDMLFVDKYDWTGRKRWRDVRNRKNLDLTQAKLLKEMHSSAEYVIPNMNKWGGKLSYKGDQWDGMTVVGTTYENAYTPAGDLMLGRYFNIYEDEKSENVVILGYNPYKAIFPDGDAIGKVIKIGAWKFRVIGVIKRRGTFIFDFIDNQVFIPLGSFNKVFSLRWKSLSIGVKAGSVDKLDEVRDETIGLMRSIRNNKVGEDDNFSINETKAFAAQTEDIRLNVWLVGIALTSLSFIVGIIGIMNIMFVSVTERTKEIGIRKALGAKRREIWMQFLVESSFLSFMGAIIAMIACSALVALAATIIPNYIPEADFLKAYLPLEFFLIASFVSIFVGILAGLIPAVKAAKLNPVDSLRYG